MDDVSRDLDAPPASTSRFAAGAAAPPHRKWGKPTAAPPSCVHIRGSSSGRSTPYGGSLRPNKCPPCYLSNVKLAEMLCQPRSRTGGARRQPEPRERERAEQREARRARYNVLVVRVAKSAPDVGEGLGRALRPLALHVGGELRRLACLAEQEHLFGREEKRPPCSVGLAK